MILLLVLCVTAIFFLARQLSLERKEQKAAIEAQRRFSFVEFEKLYDALLQNLGEDDTAKILPICITTLRSTGLDTFETQLETHRVLASCWTCLNPANHVIGGMENKDEIMERIQKLKKMLTLL